MLLAIVYTEVKQVPNKDAVYLDSIGIGASIWAVLIVMIVLQVAYGQVTIDQIEEIPISESDLQQAFGTRAQLLHFLPYPSLRLCRTVALALQAVLNITFMFYNFLVLPERNPLEHLNMSKHIVSWVEFPMACLGCFSLTLEGIRFVCQQNPGACLSLSNVISGMANFSVLSAFPYANPMKFARVLSPHLQDENRSWLSIVGLAIHGVVLAFAGVLSVIIKVEQVDFITEKVVSKWTMWECFALLGFLNNLAGLRLDGDQEKIYGVMRAHRGTKESEKKLKKYFSEWRKEFIAHSMIQYGPLGALIIVCTMSADDICVVLKRDLPSGPDEAGLRSYVLGMRDTE